VDGFVAVIVIHDVRKERFAANITVAGVVVLVLRGTHVKRYGRTRTDRTPAFGVRCDVLAAIQATNFLSCRMAIWTISRRLEGMLRLVAVEVVGIHQ